MADGKDLAEIISKVGFREALINPILREQICGIKHFAKRKIGRFLINQRFLRLKSQFTIE